jgi:transcriptional regulator with XRE-family HTH domain
VNEQEILETIGQLIKEGRLELGLAQKPFAIHSGVDTKTLATMEKGTRVAWETNQRKVETALGWRIGSIQKAIDDAGHIPFGTLTLASMKEGGGEPTWQDLSEEENGKAQGPVTRANQLSDEELLAELSYRFRNYKNRTMGIPE